MSKELELLVIEEQVIPEPEEHSTFLPSETIKSNSNMSLLPTSSPDEDISLPLLAAITMTGAGVAVSFQRYVSY